MVKISEIGEKEIVKYILSKISAPEKSLIGIGDDAIDFIEKKKRIVLSVDMLVSSTDVPKGMNLKQVGWKAITSTASDLASKGAKPLYFMTSIGLPHSLKFEEFKELWKGMNEAAKFYNGKIIAGDTNEAKEIIIDCIGIGVANKLLSRKGAKEGDIIAVTGLFGKSSSGLKILLEGIKKEGFEKLINSALNPRAKIIEGQILANSGYASACIDSSDGLALSLYEIAEASKVGIYITHSPIDKLVEKFSRKYDLSLLDLVFYGGEEYELIATIKPEGWKYVKKLFEKNNKKIIKIGNVVNRNEGISVYWENKRRILEKRGWIHFK
jgi:thiamine-monophosphate kinase